MSNPLTFFERLEMLREAMADVGVPQASFAVIPFPIESPDRIIDFLDPRVPVFTTVYDEWNHHKVRLLRERGYPVTVLWERTEKEFEGIKIRRQIAAGDQDWRAAVPEATIRTVARCGLEERLRLLSKAGGLEGPASS